MTKEISNTQDIIDSRDVIARIEELQDDLDNLQAEVDSATEQEHGRDCAGRGHGASECTCGKFDDVAEAEEALTEWQESDAAAELKALKSLQAEAEGYCPDWKYGAGLIRDSYFEDYARELAEDLGLTGGHNKPLEWPCTCIDWEKAADELKQDYTSVDFAGVDYWVRS